MGLFLWKIKGGITEKSEKILLFCNAFSLVAHAVFYLSIHFLYWLSLFRLAGELVLFLAVTVQEEGYTQD